MSAMPDPGFAQRLSRFARDFSEIPWPDLFGANAEFLAMIRSMLDTNR